MARLATEYEARGRAGAIEYAETQELRFRGSAGEELVTVIVEPLERRGAGRIDRDVLNRIGIVVDSASPSFLRVLVPVARLRELGRLEDIRRARVPIPATPVDLGYGTILSEAVVLTGADAPQLAGFIGDGIKVAVVDLGFTGLDGAIAAGEIPADVHRVKGNVEGVNIDGYTVHGVGVAEHVMDMAPGAELYCIFVEDEVDLENSAAYMRDNGILVANHSVGWVNASYYDDTGPISTIINESRDLDGVLWAVSAGNAAERHWRGGWYDPNGNDTLDFVDFNEKMTISGTQSTASIFLNWNQYGNSVTDLDLYIRDKNGVLVAASTGPQNGPQDPAEGVSFAYSSSKIPYSIQVHHYSGPTSGLDITIFSFRHNVLYPVAAASLMEPADAHGAFTVGAVNQIVWNDPDPAIEYFSSRGPTTDGREKPDIAGPDGTRSRTYGPSFGTSFSSPNTAGAAALLPQLHPGISAEALEDTLRRWAIDAGPAGWDSAYGAGLLDVVFSFDSIPAIQSIADVSDDQGLLVELAWSRSGYDYAGSPRPVAAYDILRRNASAAWDSVASVPASGSALYAAAAPTEVDSTAAGIAYASFVVRARTQAPVRFYESPPDSGYSVDNLVPGAPAGLAVSYNQPAGTLVSWSPSTEPDIDQYRIYRGESYDFVPGPASLVQATADTLWVDPVPEGYRYTYKVTAVDDAGNEGAPAAPSVTTDAECCETPLRYTLHQNFPNPFNPMTTIRFDLPETGRVRLAVYNVNGQRIRVLADGEFQRGSREVVWNGRDEAGRAVASGIYFYRLEAPDFVRSRTMILLR